MRFILPCLPTLLVAATLIAAPITQLAALAEPDQSVELATHTQSTAIQRATEQRTIDTIRKIVLNQGDDARALANLVQLTRNLSPATTSRLYSELATDYLSRAEYNQGANILQQVLNQHPDQPIAREALLRLVRLYSSAEVQHTERAEGVSQSTTPDNGGFAKYALHLANSTARKIPTLAEDPELTFQHAVATRRYGRPQAALSAMTRLKRNLQADPWRTRALAEQWLHSDRRDEPPLPILPSRKTFERPHLDGLLDESCWQANVPVQLVYDDKFLYIAIAYAKKPGLDYQPDARPRSYDADLSTHDRVEIRLDTDRDYVTAFDLAIDHRGWTNDRCWLNNDWNPKWFVAANANDSHWTAEAAIPFAALVPSSPQPGTAWAIATQRVAPTAESDKTDNFHLLLFE